MTLSLMKLSSSALRGVFVMLASVTFLMPQDVDAAYATRYWDCCKAHCSWQGNVFGGMQPLPTCNKDDVRQNDAGITSACQSPSPDSAYTCWDNVPWSINSTHAYGFAAVPATGDVCGDCFELTFTGQGHNGPNAGAAALAGKVMTVQATNIGHDVANEQFDILIPGGGVGAFDACSFQWGVDSSQLGAQFGGFLTACQQQHGFNADHATYKACVLDKCDQIFGASQRAELHAGCRFFVDWYEVADNPTLTYRRVTCPAELVQISGMSHFPITTAAPSTTPMTSPSTTSVMQPHTTTSVTTTSPFGFNDGTCTPWPHGEDGGGCLTTRCCSHPQFHCYEKNEHWAACMIACTPGFINPMDPPQFQTPWSCTELFPITTTAPSTTSMTSPSTTSSFLQPRTTTTSTTLVPTCSAAGADRWGPNLGGCCSRLTECLEPRSESDSHYCPVTDPTHGVRCWSHIQMCRSRCAGLTTSTTLVPTCSVAGADRWGPNLGGCCGGLTECSEPRSESDSHYCPVTDPNHGVRCWSHIQICRNRCAAECSGTFSNCHNTQCCSDSSLTCFEKDQFWAECKASCTPGIDPTDAPQFRTPWSCTVLSAQ